MRLENLSASMRHNGVDVGKQWINGEVFVYWRKSSSMMVERFESFTENIIKDIWFSLNCLFSSNWFIPEDAADSQKFKEL